MLVKHHSLDWFNPKKLASLILLVILTIFFTGCAHHSTDNTHDVALFQAPPPLTVAPSHSPAFLIKNPAQTFNRIGTPGVRELPDSTTEVFVDPDTPAVYFETQKFSTDRGSYTNLIYRIHFQEVPFGWGQFNLTAGRNPGILIIYTIDADSNLLLITTVHTCGCFLAFLPTSSLPPAAFPIDWPKDFQWVYGYTLPSILSLPPDFSDDQVVFTLESETHRISGVNMSSSININKQSQRELALHGMHNLFALPYKEGAVSFFETAGSRAGYVKNNTKILERIFISWWALDLHVGEDKAYSVLDRSETVFYTSLKFWARKASDLKDFPGFLTYWGWQL